MKRALPFSFLVMLVCAGVVFVWGLFLKMEIYDLKDQILAEESQRMQEDDLILDHLGDTASHLFMQIGSMEKAIRQGSNTLDFEADLPEEYLESVRFYVRDQIDALVNQHPVFSTEWEILSIRFYAPDLVAVECRDGEIHGILLVLIYPGDQGAYTGEVLFSNIRPWAG